MLLHTVESSCQVRRIDICIEQEDGSSGGEVRLNSNTDFSGFVVYDLLRCGADVCRWEWNIQLLYTEKRNPTGEESIALIILVLSQVAMFLLKISSVLVAYAVIVCQMSCSQAAPVR